MLGCKMGFMLMEKACGVHDVIPTKPTNPAICFTHIYDMQGSVPLYAASLYLTAEIRHTVMQKPSLLIRHLQLVGSYMQ